MATTPVTFSLNIDDSLIDTATAALCWKGGYQPEVTDPDPESPTYGQQIANPVTPEDGAKQAVINFILNQVTEYSNRQALAAVTPPDSSLIS
jgi:hypothetical protein